MITLAPERLVESLAHYLESHGCKFLAAWYCIPGGRNEYADGIAKNQTTFPVIPLVPRRFGLLQTANALNSDLMQLVAENRAICEAALGKWGRDKPLVFLILSREPLSVAGGSSPVALPEWFPHFGKTIVDLELVDLTHAADAPLNCKEAQVPAICEALFSLELALIFRTNAILAEDLNACDRLRTLLLEPTDDFSKFIAEADRRSKTIEHPAGFRPSVRDGDSVVARMLRLYGKTSPDQLASRATVLGEVLMRNAIKKQPLISVLLRPTARESTDFSVWGRSLLTTIYAAHQYSTASAHADGYGRYSVFLLNSVSRNIVGGLSALAASLSD